MWAEVASLTSFLKESRQESMKTNQRRTKKTKKSYLCSLKVYTLLFTTSIGKSRFENPAQEDKSRGGIHKYYFLIDKELMNQQKIS
tara:strand:- start:30 stop:287 length:258 start_codon:yes stop_codon:yes gene_type:complete